jgi:hypothetical protein
MDENLRAKILSDILAAIEPHQHQRAAVLEALVGAMTFWLASADPIYRSVLASKLEDDVARMLARANHFAASASATRRE